MNKDFSQELSAGYVMFFFNVGENRVRDHFHITGKYRDSAHWTCNINLKVTQKIPVIFHNLRGL